MAKKKRKIKPERPPEKVQLSRRSFLNRLWTGLGILVLVEIVWVALSFVRPRKQAANTGGFGARMMCGPVEGFEKVSVTAFARGHFYLCRLADGGFLALSRQCTHLGCTVPWDDEKMKFICPCHASAFDITGNVLAAPATRALDLFAVDIENNVVRVDTGRRIKRSGFQSKQVVYPKADIKKDS